MLASFMAAEAAGAMGAFEVAGAAMGAAEAASAMEAAGAAEAFGAGEALGAFDASVGLGGGMFGAAAPTTGAGITQAAMGEATQSALAGGAGAGEAGINAQMVNASQNAATSAANSGLPQAAAPTARGITQAAAPAIEAGATDRSLGQAGANAVAGNADKAALLSNEGYTGNVAGINAGTGAEPPSFFDNPFMKGVSSVMNWADKNPFKSAGIAYMGAKKLGLLDDNTATAANRVPDKGMGYSMSPDFQGRFADPKDFQYTPKRYNYAEGGIMQADGVPTYAKGDLTSSLDYYSQMMDQRARPPSGKAAPRGERGDAGIYYDLDPDTRYQDALTAAQIRQAKVNKRAHVQMPGIKRPTPMGQIDLTPPGTKREAPGSSLDPENAAQGGIMRASTLGGYAAGGNPRLLKGPGDGMSDNIPATINGRQPARLADGEFVVPADVVSHLGNGSTDAGAKILHRMMTQVRKERTGNPKQGKQINPNKFVPK